MTKTVKNEAVEFYVDLARIGFEEDLHRLMELNHISRSELAATLEVSPAYISKALNGSENYTIRTMARIGRAVGSILQIRLVRDGSEVVRVVDYETAAALDDASHNFRRALQPDGGAEVVDLEEYRKIGRRETNASSSGSSLIRAEG